MLTISNAQLERIDAVIDDDLSRRLFQHARTVFAAFTASMDDAALTARIAEDVAAARGFGVQTPRGLLHFVSLALLRSEPRLYEYQAVADGLRAAPDVEEALARLIDEVIVEMRARLAKEKRAG